MRADPLFDSQGLDALEKGVKVWRGEVPDADEHAVGGAQPEVAAGDGGVVPLKEHAPGRDGFGLVAQVGQFAHDNGLKPEGARGDDVVPRWHAGKRVRAGGVWGVRRC